MDAQNVPLGFKIDVIRLFYRGDRFDGRGLFKRFALCQFHFVVAGLALVIERSPSAWLIPDPLRGGQMIEAMDALDLAHG